MTITVTPVEAGIISILSKLGKATNKVDGPDVDLPSSFHFKEAVTNLPEGSAAEISIVNGRWLAKTPDGKQRPVDEFVANVDGLNERPTLILAESSVPKSFGQFNGLPRGVAVKIISRNGKIYSLNRTNIPPTLIYKNIELVLSDTTRLDSVLWQLQRPAMNQKVRFVQLAKDVDAELPNQVYSSNPVVDAVGVNKLINSIKNMRLETIVLSGKVKNGFLHHDGQRILIKDLEKAAASRDVNLIILGSDKPKKALRTVADDWKAINSSGDNLYDSVGDFYNRFSPIDSAAPMRIKVTDSGELQTAFYIERKVKTAVQPDADTSGHITVIPLHLLIESVKILQPNEERVKELDRRIHPSIDSSVQFYLIISFFVGAFTAITSWFLYKKIWQSPLRVTYRNVFSFAIMYTLHRLCFIVLYLPTLGIFSPIYLILKWTAAIINYLLIRPARWLITKFN
ncbi:MAG: hypothetical protein ACKE9I_09840 [Methylophagaceae bacterium]